MNRHRMWWLIPCATTLLVGGCSSTDNQVTDNKTVNSDLDSLMPDDTDETVGPDVDQLAADFERGLEELDALMNTPRPPSRGETRAPEPAPARTEPTTRVADISTEQRTRAADPPKPQVESPPAPDELIRKLSTDAADLLRQIERDDPYSLALRLVALRAAGEGSIPGLDLLIEGLPPDEREAVAAVAAVLSGLDSDPAMLADVLEERANSLSESRPIRIVQSALCSRVEGFGRYTELEGDGFVAGSPMRMIIYTEVAHFDQKPVSGGGEGTRWEVKLSQELQLFHESDGLLAWRRPEETTVYRTKSRLRDYFVVNQIELPRNLTVGAYRLKIVMRDLSDRSVDERIIPIRVVADPRLAAGLGG